MDKRIVFTRKAYSDIDRIVEFNNRRNQSDTYSRKFVKQLASRLLALKLHPLTGLKTDMADVFVLIWDNYYIFYRNLPEVLEVTAVYHQKEDIEF